MPTLRPARPEDAAAICAIYNPFIVDTAITFEETPVDVAEMAARIASISPWLVCEIDGALAGYAYAAPWKTRAAYRHSVESSVYVAPHYARRGVGRLLYGALLDELRARGVHSVVGGIALPNEASVAMHEALGFEKIARFREVGSKFGQWIDVGYWQLLL